MASIWQLPSAGEFLAEVEVMIWQGGGVICVDAAMPPGLAAEVERIMHNDMAVVRLDACAGEQPLTALCSASMCRVDLPGVASMQNVLMIVDLTGLDAPDARAWAIFMPRFHDTRQALADGASLVALCLPEFECPKLPRLQMSGRIRRGDATIWAEFGAGTQRSGLLEHLAVSVAVELCGWRLDLIEDLVNQRTEDILAPQGWLRRNLDLRSDFVPTFAGKSFACPIALLAAHNSAEIDHRLWKAQITTVFPWIEQQRLQFIDRYRKNLRIDAHSERLGVAQVEDLEFGALKWQLRSVAARSHLELITAFAAMRNSLAHRKPVPPKDLAFALSTAGGTVFS
jgi:hypothetical protein